MVDLFFSAFEFVSPLALVLFKSGVMNERTMTVSKNAPRRGGSQIIGWTKIRAATAKKPAEACTTRHFLLG